MAQIESIPQKPFYRISEVCQLTDTQPYVLRFWESEFPQLAPERSGGGQPVYKRKDIDVVLRIKQLLHDEEFTIDGARRQLSKELRSGKKRSLAPPEREGPVVKSGPRPASAILEERPPAPLVEPAPAPGTDVDDDYVARGRYDDAVEEIENLRLQLQEAEGRARRAESAAERDRELNENAVVRLERLLFRIAPDGD